MIHVISYGNAKSDEGFEIRQRHFHYISYIEGDYGLRIPRKVISNKPHKFIIDFNHMTGWFPPHQNEAISLEKQKQIIDRVTKAMKLLVEADGVSEYSISLHSGQLIFQMEPYDNFKALEVSQKSLGERRNKINKIK